MTLPREIKFRFWDTHFKKMFTSENMNSYEVWDCVMDDRFIKMQYTGLKDRNGVEIYEGDIIRSYNNFGDVFEKLTVVKWDDKEVCYLGIVTNDLKNEEVIGNIYEHPHLLPKEEEPT